MHARGQPENSIFLIKGQENGDSGPRATYWVQQLCMQEKDSQIYQLLP